MATDTLLTVVLAIILGTLGAIIYSLRILVLLERRIARMDHHIELMTMAVLKDERRLLAEEKKIEALVQKQVSRKSAGKSSSKRKATKSSSKKKSTAKKSAKKKSSKKAAKKSTRSKKSSRKKK